MGFAFFYFYYHFYPTRFTIAYVSTNANKAQTSGAIYTMNKL